MITSKLTKLVIVFFLFTLLGNIFLVRQAYAVQKWQRWEKSFTSSKTYDNPYVNVTLNVVYTSPSGKTYNSKGFWDGGSTFKIRFMFPETGTWQYRTTCSDTTNSGLHNKSGNIPVDAYLGSNPLYKHGYLKVSPGKRYLEHWDGTPFLWIADTTWQAGRYATDDEWDNYIKNRKSKNITAIILGCITNAPASTKDAEGNTIFTSANPLKVNPASWRNFEDKIKLANDNNIFILATGTIKGNILRSAPNEHVLKLQEYIAARLANMHVIISPEQDWGDGNIDLHHLAGQRINQTLPFHLITQHPKRNNAGHSDPPGHVFYDNGEDWAMHYYYDSYLDFSGLQTGNGASLPDGEALLDNNDMNLVAKDHILWIDHIYDKSNPKPLIIEEGLYEANHDQSGAANIKKMLRRQGYWSILNGAYGFSSSTQGIWGWGKVNLTWANPPIKSPPLSQALNYVYADYLKNMVKFFSSIEWWRLKPNYEFLIKNQSSYYRNRMMLAKSVDGDLAVAYLPDNSQIKIDMSSFSESMNAYWYNTIKGEYQDGPSSVANNGTYTFSKPGSWDDTVLLLVSATEDNTPLPAPKNVTIIEYSK
jgi:hypothetical protein